MVVATAPFTSTRPSSRRNRRRAPARARRPVRAAGAAEPIQEYPADPNEVIQALHGFKVEIVAKADRPTQGSWISITEDDQGRLILGANEQQPFTRLTLDKAGKVTKTETIFTPVSESMGITWHDNASTCRAAGSRRPFTQTMDNPGFGRQSGQAGLHRLRDPKGDGSFTTVDTLRTWDGGEGGHSDHGIHEARVSPDGKHFYIINGNGVVMPPDMSPNSPLRNYADDRIIPLLGPQTGRLGQEKAPGGTIARTTFDGKDFHLFAGGMRNALHFDWNADGEIFSFDSDMEPEFGVPWYRPVRVFWMPSGADLGYRGNSGKYPTVVRGLAAAARGDRTGQPGRRDVRLPDGVSGAVPEGAASSPTTTTAGSSRSTSSRSAAATSRPRGRTSSGRSRSTARRRACRTTSPT